MVEWNIIKHCLECKDRFTVSKGESKRLYCKPCKIKINKRLKGGKK